MKFNYRAILPSEVSIESFASMVLADQDVILTHVASAGCDHIFESSSDNLDTRKLIRKGYKISRLSADVVSDAYSTTYTTDDYTPGVTELLESKAKEYGYDNIVSACSYATSTVPKFLAEGRAFSEWRDLCWTLVFGITDTSKTPDEVMGSLPVFEDILNSLAAK